MILVIAEKPSVAKSIADVLNVTEKKNGYFQNDNYIVSWCVGHLLGLASPEFYGQQYADKSWNFDTLPILPSQWKFQLNPSTKAQFDILKNLINSPKVTELVCATDAGREGECIFRYVYGYVGCKKPVKRLWVSSLENNAVRQAFCQMKDDSHYDNLFDAGFSRAKADWLVGMNFTRLFSIRYQNNFRIGRVQTPTLAMIVDRNFQVKNFVKEKFFTVDLDCGNFTVSSERIDNEQSAIDLMQQCNGKQAVISDIERTKKTVRPPKLYDLTTLQREANRYFGYTAQQTLDYTQSLYEQKLLTYPRTDSQYITDDMKNTVTSLIPIVCQHFYNDEKISFNVGQCINNAKVSDHHAIIPTKEINSVNLKELPQTEYNILLLIAMKLLIATADPYSYESIKITVNCQNHTFFGNGIRVIDYGFKKLETFLRKQLCNGKSVPENETQNFHQIHVETVEKVIAKKSDHFTVPPKQYTEDTLLSAMETAGNNAYDETITEKKGLGTPATRASIIESLINHDFIQRDSKKLIPTDKGIKLIKALPEEIKSPKMTAEWETALQNIEQGKESPSMFLQRIENFIRNIVREYSFVDTTTDFHTKKTVGICPKCGKKIVEYKKFYACESGKDGCGFIVWKTVSGKEITSAQAKKILEKGKSDLIKGFISKTGKNFDAYLKLDTDCKVVFEFPKSNFKKK